MRLFRRNKTDAFEEERCPQCREPVPPEVDACAMCGADLRPLRPRDYDRPLHADSDRHSGRSA